MRGHLACGSVRSEMRRRTGRFGLLVLLVASSLLGSAGDGARPAASTPAGEIVFTRSATWYSEGHDLYVVRPDGSELRLLVRNGADAAGTRDGRLIAFVRERAIWVMNRNGSGQRAVTTPSRGVDDSGPAWAVGGQTIFFARWEDATETMALYRVQRDGTALRRLTSPEPTQYAHCHADPSPSRTGRVIAFADWISCQEGALVSLRAITNLGRPARLPFRIPDLEIVKDPTWAPNGRLLAYAAMAAGEETLNPAARATAIYVSAAVGSRPRRVGRTRYQDNSPAWSPDSRWIVFARTATARATVELDDIWLMRRDGTSPRRLTRGAPVDTSPAWLPAAR